MTKTELRDWLTEVLSDYFDASNHKISKCVEDIILATDAYYLGEEDE